MKTPLAIAFALCCLAAAACAPTSKFGAALEAYGNQDYDMAVTLWRSAAKDGDPRSQYWLARSYYTGRGVEQDRKAALDWFRRAAWQGHDQAAGAVGSMYRFGIVVEKNMAMAIRWYDMAAGWGNSWAFVLLGDIHLKGEGVPVDLASAHGYYTEASKRGEGIADYRLGRMNLLGLGRTPNPREAVRHFEAAAIRGDRLSLLELGDMFRTGKHVPTDVGRAKGYYHRGAAMSDNFARYYLGLIARDVDNDPQSAFRWWKEAALAGGVGMPELIAQLILSGKLAPARTRVDALGWLLVGRHLGDPEARRAASRLSRRMTPSEIAQAESWSEGFLTASPAADPWRTHSTSPRPPSGARPQLR